MKKLIFFSAMLVIVLSGCKKYPEGPSFSLRSKKERVANNWQIEKVLENGTDKTEDYKNYLLKDFTLITSKNETYSVSYKVWFFGSYIDAAESGNWYFNGDKTKIIMDPTSNNDANEEWDILKLKEDEFWIRDPQDDYGNMVELHLIPK